MYLKEYKRAQTEVSLRKINTKISQLHLQHILHLTEQDRVIHLSIDHQVLTKAEELDWAYVVKPMFSRKN